MADPFTQAVIRAVIFVASVVIQNKKQQQLKRQQEAAAEERKGFTFTTSGEAVPVPVVYGKNLLGGITVKHHITSNYISSSITGTNNFNQGFTNTTASGTKNEYLHVQHALCQDGIESVVGVKVNNLDYNDSEQRFNHLIRTYRTGGIADPIATANGIASTNSFTGTAYASSTFKLDRDDPQYNGAPEMGFIVKGRRVRSVTLSGSTYSLGAYSYSNNPALCLLDYLLNTDFGRGLSTSEVDLQSFYEAAIVCGTVVTTRAVSGIVNGGATSRSIPLYECNIVIDPSKKIRDNIEAIMSTMALAELTWSSEGKYKLLVEYPTTLAQQNALVDTTHYFTDDDIIRNEVSLSWPSASERYNQITISFLNEHEDFKTDSVTWPKSFSTTHNQYLTEDNNQPFMGSFNGDGITDPYHAQATAEQLVRESRQTRTITLTVAKKGLSIEPGDFINITSDNCNISNEVYRVQSIEVNSDFTVKLTCTYFDYQTLAWNVNDDIAYSTRPTFDFKVEPVTGLTYTAGAPETDRTAVAELTWTAPTDGSFKCVVYYTVGGVLQILGETTGESFVIHPRPEWFNGQSVTFTVKAQTPLGRLSTGVAVANSVVRIPEAPTSFSVSEDLYQTNKASGVKARATISFSPPSGGVDVKDFKVEYYRDADGSTYKLLGYTVGTTYN
ncbi:phage tail protein, partial [Candidatus Pelagibacter sp.]|nr:phage tail protein [Candidatus Pelagibacter sp.]